MKLFASLRLPGVDRVEVSVGPGATVADVLEALFEQAPSLREQILQPDGTALLPHVNVMLRGRLIRDLQGLQTKVDGYAELAIFPPVAGG